MNDRKFPIPAKTNITIAIIQLFLLLAILSATALAKQWSIVFLLAFAYGIVMNSGYAMLHEAEHNLLHPNHFINDLVGSILALFFPAPFHLIRQGHIGHHLRNRSDDEAFDFYFEGENPIWKNLQLYGILTGLFWVTIVLSNFIALLNPNILRADSTYKVKFDRPTEALIETLNPKYLPLIRMEALCCFILHGSLIYFLHISIIKYFVVLFGFGFMWSALQYVHHFGTDRDVRKGAKNLKTFSLLDIIWLNHNWHLSHHTDPTIPWIYLPHLEENQNQQRGNLLKAYFLMWQGPKKTTQRVKNHYAGRIIR